MQCLSPLGGIRSLHTKQSITSTHHHQIIILPSFSFRVGCCWCLRLSLLPQLLTPYACAAVKWKRGERRRKISRKKTRGGRHGEHEKKDTCSLFSCCDASLWPRTLHCNALHTLHACPSSIFLLFSSLLISSILSSHRGQKRLHLNQSISTTRWQREKQKKEAIDLFWWVLVCIHVNLIRWCMTRDGDGWWMMIYTHVYVYRWDSTPYILISSSSTSSSFPSSFFNINIIIILFKSFSYHHW